MSSKSDDMTFGVGETYYGRNPQSTSELALDVANSKLQGGELLGRVYEIEDRDYANVDGGVIPERTKVRRKLMAVRNVTGAAILPKRLVKLQVSGLGVTANVSGYARLDHDQFAYPVDEALPAAGCPDDDICYIVIEGPAMCTMPLSQVGDIADGQPLTALTAVGTTAITAGMVQGVDAANTDATLAMALNVIGHAMSAKSSSATASDILVNIRRHH